MPSEHPPCGKILYVFPSDRDSLEVSFSLFLTATCMTTLEIYLAYKQVFPGIKWQMQMVLDKLRQQPIPLNLEPMKGELDALLETIEARERVAVEHLNAHSKVFATLLIGSLVLCILRIRLALRKHGRVRWLPYRYASYTIVMLALFQIGFFLMVNTFARPAFLKDLPAWKFPQPASLTPPVVAAACTGVGPGGAASTSLRNLLDMGVRIATGLDQEVEALRALDVMLDASADPRWWTPLIVQPYDPTNGLPLLAITEHNHQAEEYVSELKESAVLKSASAMPVEAREKLLKLAATQFPTGAEYLRNQFPTREELAWFSALTAEDKATFLRANYELYPTWTNHVQSLRMG